MEYIALKIIIVFLGTFFTDVCWVLYLLRIQQRKALDASFWGMSIYLLGALVVTVYVDDKWYIIPAAIGSFVGTYVVLIFKKK